MEHLLLIIIGILLPIIFVLAAKVYFLRKSAQEIREAFRDRLTADTNTLIAVSARDPYMRKLAADINVQLRLLREERHRYQQGGYGAERSCDEYIPRPQNTAYRYQWIP